jgi:hypothetical protein
MVKKSKKTVSVRKNAPKKIEEVIESSPIDTKSEYQFENTDSKKSSKFQNIVIIIFLAALALGIFAYKKGYIVAATVNGSPIYKWDLNKVMMERFGNQTIEMLITEKLIENEANKNNLTVTAGDVKTRQDEMVKKIGGGVSLEDLLKFQGMTKDEFDKQVKLQLTVEKILEKDTPVTDNDIKLFISTNSAQLKASSEAEMKEEARKMILEQKIGEKISVWFNDLKSKASIRKFL